MWKPLQNTIDAISSNKDKSTLLRTENKNLRLLNTKMSNEFRAQREEMLWELSESYETIDRQRAMINMLKKEVSLETFTQIQALASKKLTSLAIETLIESVEGGDGEQ